MRERLGPRCSAGGPETIESPDPSRSHRRIPLATTGRRGEFLVPFCFLPNRCGLVREDGGENLRDQVIIFLDGGAIMSLCRKALDATSGADYVILCRGSPRENEA